MGKVMVELSRDDNNNDADADADGDARGNKTRSSHCIGLIGSHSTRTTLTREVNVAETGGTAREIV